MLAKRGLRAARWIIVLLLLGTSALLVRAAWDDSVTTDEALYMHSGACAVNAGLIDLESTNPAGFKLMAGIGIGLSGIPTDEKCSTTSYRTLLRQGSATELRRLAFFARLPAIAVTLGLVLICAMWAFQMGGPLAAVLAAAFVGFEPTVLAYGHLTTGDVPLSLGVVGCLASLWNWRATGRKRWLAFAGLAFGFALLNKASAVLVLPLAVAVLVVTDDGRMRERLRRVVPPSLIVGAIAYGVLVVVYAPFQHNEPNRDLLPRGFNWALPQSWLWGANWQRRHVSGSGNFTTYVNGERHTGGTLMYFPEALLFKLTIGALLAVTVGVAVLLIRRRYRPLAWCALPAALYVGAAMFSGINIGIRYVAPAIVLLMLAASVGLAAMPRRALPLGGLVAVAAITATTLGPVGSIGYFNALAADRNSYYLADSNIDYGQDGWRLRDWWERAGRPPLQVDMFGGFPARFYVPSAIDVGQHRERLDDTLVPDVADRTLIVSINTGTLQPRRARAVEAAQCYIGTGLVIVTTKAC